MLLVERRLGSWCVHALVSNSSMSHHLVKVILASTHSFHSILLLLLLRILVLVLDGAHISIMTIFLALKAEYTHVLHVVLVVKCQHLVQVLLSHCWLLAVSGLMPDLTTIVASYLNHGFLSWIYLLLLLLNCILISPVFRILEVS